MLALLFCDDDPFFLRMIRTLAEEFLSEHKPDALCIGTALCGEDAVTLRRKYPGPCAVFLDLDFGSGHASGLDIARRLRQTPDTRVIFTTNHRERAMEVLRSGVEPYGFLEKSTDLSRLADGLGRYLRMVLTDTRSAGGTDPADIPSVTLRTGGETVTIPIRDILYLETEKHLSHGITYHTSGGSVLTVIGTMEEERRRLGEHFCRVHRSYTVQDSHVAALRKGELILSDGTRIPCSPAAEREVKKWLNASQNREK